MSQNISKNPKSSLQLAKKKIYSSSTIFKNLKNTTKTLLKFHFQRRDLHLMRFLLSSMRTQRQSSFLMEQDFTDLKKTMLHQKKPYTPTLKDLNQLKMKLENPLKQLNGNNTVLRMKTLIHLILSGPSFINKEAKTSRYQTNFSKRLMSLKRMNNTALLKT